MTQKTKAQYIADTATVGELLDFLEKIPKDTKIFLSKDSEGNSFSTVSPSRSIEHVELDDVIIIYPFFESLESDEIIPKEIEQLNNEYDAQVEARAS